MMKKKNIKYIGSAVAVALLAAGSPIIINQVIPSTVVEAAGQAITNPDLTPTQMLENFRNQFDDRYVASTDSLTTALKAIVEEDSPHPNFFYFSSSNLQHIYDIQNNTGISKLKDQDKKLDGSYFGKASDGGNPDYYYRDIMGYLSITGGGETEPIKLTKFEDLTTLADEITAGTVKLPITVGIHLVQGTEGLGTVYPKPGSLDSIPEPELDSLKNFSFKINPSRLDITKDTKAVSVPNGTSTSDKTLQSGNNSLAVTDNYSNPESDKGDMARTAIYGKSLFDSADAALKYAQSDTFDPTVSTAGNVGSNGKISTGGTYYQTVSYKLDNGKDKAIEYMLSGGTDELTGSEIKPYDTYINGSDTRAVDGTDYAFNRLTNSSNQNIGMVTVVRPVTVGSRIDSDFTNNPKVTVGSSALDDNTTLSDTSDDKLKDDYGNEVATSGIKFGTTYYTDPAASDADVATDAVVDGKFAKTGTYYRRVTFTLASGSTNGLKFSDDKVDSTDTTVTFSQPVTVGVSVNIADASSKVGSPESDTTSDTSGDTLNNGTVGALIDTKQGNNGISFGTDYYDSTDDANEILNGTATSKPTPVSGVVDANKNFVKDGDYLRTITFHLSADSAIDTDHFEASGQAYNLNTANNTVTYIQKVHIASSTSATATLPTTTVSSGRTLTSKNWSPDKTSANLPIDQPTVTDGEGKNLVNGIVYGTNWTDSKEEALKNVAAADSSHVYKSVKRLFGSDGDVIYHTITITLNDGTSIKDEINFEPSGLVEGEDYTINGDTITYAQKGTFTSVKPEVNIDDENVNFGSKLTDIEMSTPPIEDSGVSIYIHPYGFVGTKPYNNNSDDENARSVEYSDVFYDDSNRENVDSGVVINGVFAKPGSFYREVTIPLLDGWASGFDYSTDKNFVSVDKKNNTVTYLQKVTVTAPDVTSNITTATASVGETADNVSDNGTTDITTETTLDDGTTQTSSIIDATKTSYGNQYFTSAADALSNTDGTERPFTTASTTDPYYRRVTLTLASGKLSDYEINGTSGTDYIDNGDGTVTFAQPVTVGTAEVTPTLKGDVTVTSGEDISSEQGNETNTITGVNGTSLVDKVTFGDYYSADNDDEAAVLADILSGNNTNTTTDPVNGTVYGKAGDYYRTVILHLKKGALDSYTINGATDAQINKNDNTVTYLQKVTVTVPKVTSKITGATAKVGETADNVSDNGTTDITLNDGTGSIIDKTAYGDQYFTSATNALNNIDGTTGAFTTVTTSDKPYYRRVTLTLANGKLLSDYAINGISGTDYIDNGDGTVTFAQPVTVGAAEVTPTLKEDVTVTSGEDISSEQGGETNTITGVNGTSLVDKVTFGDYYPADNTDETVALTDILDGKISATTDPVNGTVYGKAGTYYRTVVLHLKKDALDSYTIKGATDAQINKNDNTVTYLQKVTVEAAEVTPTLKEDVTVTSGEDISSEQGGETNTIVKNNSIVDSVTFGSYYPADNTDEDAALADILGGKTSATTDPVNGTVYGKAGTYYRTIVLHLKKDALDSYTIKGATDAQINKNDNTVTYLQKVNVIAPSVMSNITGANAKVGETADKVTDDGTADITLNDGSSIIDSTKTSYGKQYFTSAANALNNIDGTTGAFTTVTTSGKPYYRLITLTLANGKSLNDYAINGISGKDYINNGDGTVTFAQQVTVTAPTVTVPSVTSNITGANAKVGDSVNKLTDNGTTDITLDDGNSIVDSTKTSYGDQYFTSATNALNNIDGTTGAFTTVTTSDKPYYRLVTLTLADGKSLNDYAINGISGKDYIDNGDGTVTFAQQVTVTAPTVTVPSVTSNITGANAKVGDSVNKLTDNGTADITLDDGNSIIDSTKTSYGNQYYTSATNALKNIDGTTGAFTTVTTSDKPYYRLVTLTLADGKSLSDYAINGTSGKDYINNGNETVTFAQEVTVTVPTVTIPSVTSNITGANAKVGDSVNKLTDNGTTDITLDDGNSIIDSTKTSYGDQYFTSATDALSNTKGTTGPFTTVTTSDKPYYRLVTLTLADGKSLSDYAINGISGKDYIDNGNGTVTFAQEVTVTAPTVTVPSVTSNITGANAKVGDSVNKLTDNGTADITLDDGNSIIDSTKTSYGDQYFTSATNALNNIDGITGSFTTASVYYRLVTLTLSDGKSLSDYAINGTSGKDYIDNGDGTVTFAQQVTVSKATTNSIAATVNTDTVTSTVGSLVSTLPATNKNYTLTTADGKTIETKASAGTTVYRNQQLSDLVKDSSFDTAGTYYRVITFKVVNDNDQYTFTDPNVISNKDGIITYIQAINVTAPEVTVATVNVDKVTSTVGSLVSTLPATNKNYTLTTADGKNIASEVSAGTTVYRSYDAGKLTDPVTSFDAVGTYYRVITFKAVDADKYSFVDPNVITNKDGVITYVQPISVGQESGTKVSQAVTDTKNVKVDVDGEDSSLSSKDGYSLTDADGNSLIDAPTAVAGISFSPEYYIMKDNTLTPADSSDAHGYTIAKKGIYYRKVIFKVSANTIANYDFSDIKGEVNKTDSTVSFLQRIDASTNPATATITSPSVSYNTSSDAASLKDSTGVTLQDDKGNAINSGNPTFSGIFSNKQNAQNATSDDGNVTGDLKEGSYYQRVTFPLDENDNNAYDFGDGIVSQDGKSVTYIREITVKPNTNTGGNTGNNTGSNTGNNNNSTGTGDEDDWTYYYDNYGVVTTKTDQDSYQLNNHANEAIENRELAKDTSWKTDEYRTNREGVKQYRVATNEWIDSNDVYFVGNGDEDDWTYYYDNYGVVKTKADQNSYQLNNRANEAIKNRELGKNTSWKTDEYRTNREGVKQYRVATNEWIDSRDVYLIDNEDDWTYYKDSGVVRTVIGQDYYSLKNWTNETVKNRALIKQSSWLTDQYRTNRAGVKQYHVATNEWIDSHDVTFIKNIKGIVNVNEASSYYKLYNIDREVINNRALQKDTSWLADKEAIDPAGNVYYRVATNEWVKKVEGVYLDTKAWY